MHGERSSGPAGGRPCAVVVPSVTERSQITSSARWLVFVWEGGWKGIGVGRGKVGLEDESEQAGGGWGDSGWSLFI